MRECGTIPAADEEVPMSSRQPKQMVYYYDGDQSNPDVQEDLDGEHEIPLKDSQVNRRGRSWRVVIVNEERGAKGQLPVYKIFLASVT